MIFLKILLGIFGLSLVVLIHEFGHFVVARMVGVSIETFSIGFGRRLIGYQKNGTDFRISLFPLGGYCRFSGEKGFRKALDDELTSIPSEEGDYYYAGPWRRIAIAFAGPVANLLFSILALGILAGIGYEEFYTEPRIVLVSDWNHEDQIFPADRAGFQTGDLVVSIENQDVDRFTRIRELMAFSPGENMSVMIRRDGELLSLSVTPELDADSGAAILGVYQWLDPVVGAITEGSVAERIGFKIADRILSIDGVPTPHTVAVGNLLDESEGIVDVVIDRNGSELQFQMVLPDEGPLGFSYSLQSRPSPEYGFFGSLVEGTRETGRMLEMTWKSLGMLFQGSKFQNLVAGPTRLLYQTGDFIATGFSQGASLGFRAFFEFISLISVSLAFLNLLPIPVLDGGQILLFLQESIRRRSLNPKSVYRYQFVGTMIVLAIAVMATAGDFLYFIAR